MLKDKLIIKIRDYIDQGYFKSEVDLNKSYKVEFLAQGEYNINFTVYDDNLKFVFRVNTGSQLGLENQIKYEYDALKILEVSSVTPRVLFVDDSKTFFDKGILAMEFLEGRPLEYSQDLGKAGEIFSRIHSLNLKNIDTSGFIVEDNIFSDRIDEGKRLLNDFFQSDIIDIDLKNFFYRFLDWSESNRNKEKYFQQNKWHTINNTEVNSHNFIIGKENSYLIDWEKPVISDPCQDITQFLAPTTTLWKANYILTKDEKDYFFKSYISGLKGLDKNIKERVYLYTPYLYLRALSWCAYAYLEYQNPNKDIKNMDTYNKIKEYLDVNFMRNLLKEYF